MNTIVEHINSAGFLFVEFAVPMLVQSGVLIVILLLADLLLRKKVKAVFRYWIWMLVLVKLVLPTSLSSPLSLGYLFGDKLTYQDLAETTSALELVEPAPAEASPGINPLYIQPNPYVPPKVPVTSVVEPVIAEPVSPPEVPVTPLSWHGVVFLVWLAVVIAMGLLLLQRALFVRGLVAQAKKASRLMSDELAYCCASMRIKCRVGLKVSPNATTPSVCGLIRPVILVPWNLASTLGVSRMRTILMHELAHIKRGDLWVNLAQTALQIIYFYNPLLWLANCLIRRIREQAVDEAVLVAMGAKAQKYPQTLVDVARMAFKRPALSLRLIGVVESKSALAGRIKHILSRPMPRSAKLGIVGILAIIIAGAVLLPMARAQRQPEPETNAEVASLEHFVGKYAIAAQPDTAAFEITRKGDVFIFSDLGGPKFEMEEAEDGLKFADGGGERFHVRYDASRNVYYLDNLGMRGEVQDGFSSQLTELVKISAEEPDGTFAATLPNGVTVEQPATIRVPEDYPTEYAAVKAAKAGDTIVVSADRYRGEDILIEPELEFLAWHKTDRDNYWHADGSIVSDKNDLRILKNISHPGCGDPQHPNYEWLKLSFSHPSFDEKSYIELRMINDTGEHRKFVSVTAAGAENPEPRNGHRGWVLYTVSLGTKEDFPRQCNFELDYAIGQWKTEIKELTKDDNGIMTFGSGFLLGSIGQNAEGKTTIDYTHKKTETSHQQHRFVAVTQNGIVPPSGHAQGGYPDLYKEEYRFDIPLEEIQHFQFQTRQVKTATFKNVSLQPNFKTDVQVGVEAARAGISLPVRKVFSGKSDKGGSFEWETSIDPRVRFRHGWYTVEDGAVREHVGGGSQISEESKLNLKLDVEVKDNMLNLKVQRVHDSADGSRTEAVASKTPVPTGAHLKHVSTVDSAVLTNNHLTLWQGDFIRDGKVLKSVIYAAYLTTPDDKETGFKPPKLQEGEIVTSEVRPDVGPGIESSVSPKLVMLLDAINSCAAETDLNIDSISITDRSISIKGDTSDRANTRKFLDVIKDNGLNVSSLHLLNAKDNRDKFSIVVEPKQDWQQWWQQRKTDVQLGFEETVTPKLIMLLVAIKSVAAEMDLNIESISVSAKSMSIEGDTSGRTDTLRFLDAIKDNGLDVSRLSLDTRKNNRDRFRMDVEPKKNWRQWWQKHKTDIKAKVPAEEEIASKRSYLKPLLGKPPIFAYDVKLNFADPTVRDGSFHSEQRVAFSLSFHNIEIPPAGKFTLSHLLIGQTTWPVHLEDNGITIKEGVAGQKITSLKWPAGESRFEKVIKIPVKYGQKEYSCPVRVELDRRDKETPTGSYWFCAYLSGRLPWGAGGRGFEIVNLDQQMEFRLTGDGSDPRDAVLGIDINGDGRIDPAKTGGEQFDLYEPFVIGSKVYQLAEVDPYLPRVVFRELDAVMLPNPLTKAAVPIEFEIVPAGSDVHVEAARAKKTVSKQLSFGPAIEQEIEIAGSDDETFSKMCLIDFETGKLYSLPDNFRKLQNNTEGELFEELVYQWCRQDGIDTAAIVEYGKPAFVLKLGKPAGTFLDAGPYTWESIKPDKLMDALEHEDLSEKINLDRPAAAFAFRTIEGNAGLLDVLDITDKTVKIRYKMVKMGPGIKTAVPVEGEQGTETSESKTKEPKDQEPVKDRGGISGIVVHSITGEPVVGAYVGVGDFGDSGGSNYSRHRSEGFHDKTKTDAEGRFELNGLVFTDKHRELQYHPLVVTHPDFVRHDEKIELLSGGPVPEVKVSLRPAAKIDVTIVDGEGNPLEGQWLLRLEALDGRRFIPPGSDPHLSSFASNIWAHWPDMRANMGVSNGFTFTELDSGRYLIEAIRVRLVDKPTPGNIWKPTITYHGSIPSLKIEAGRSKQVRLTPQDHQTKLTITAPEFPDKLFDKLERSSQMPLMCLISRSPGALLWDDGKIRHLEDQRLGRIDKERFFRGYFSQGQPLIINNLPPGSYSLFTMAVYGQVAGYLIGARADLAKGDNITLDIPWRQPTGPSMFGPNRSFDYPVKLEARDYSVSQLCEILTEITQSNPRIIADPSIETQKLNFGKSQMSIWDVLEKLYLDNGWIVEEGQDKMLIIKPAEHTDVRSTSGQDESNRPFIVSEVDNKAALTSGATVEFLGLTYIPVAEDLWWGTDGSPLPKAPFDDVSFTPSVDPNWQQFAYYTVAIQIKGKLPREIGLLKWNFSDAVYGGSTSAYADEKRVYYDNIHSGAAKFPKAVKKTTLRLGIVSGDWQTIFAGSHYGFYEKGRDTAHVRTPETVGGPGGVRPYERGLHIEVTYNITDRDFRVVAVDKDGKVHLSSRGGSGGTQNLRRTTASFPELTHDQLQEFRFQVRSYGWVEFKDVSLRPSEKALALAGQRRVSKQKELEKWLGQGKERRIRKQILILRESRLDHINEPCVEQTEAISAMRELVRIGEPAVQELTTELRQAEHWLEKSLIVFVLRAIGNERSVPVLIEVLAQSKYRGEYGIYVKEDELAKFMLDHQHREPDESDRKVHSVIIACPVIEITAALEKVTDHTEGHEHYGHKATTELGRDAPHDKWQQRVQEIVRDVASRWQKWWENNEKKTDVSVEGEREDTSDSNRIEFLGFDLTDAPHKKKAADLPDLFEARPPGSKSYRRREDIDIVYSRLDGKVYYIPEKEIFYIQHDKLGASTLTYYGPFNGDPHKFLGPKKDVPVDVKGAEAVSGESKVATSEDGPRITFESLVCDLGQIPPNTKHVCEFKYTNTGNALLKITRVGAACACTVPQKTRECAPGESETLKVTYRASGRAGRITKSVYVYCNDKVNPKVKLTIKAEIVIKVAHEPETLNILLKGENAGCPAITLTSLDNQPFSITGFKSTGFKSTGDSITADFDSSVNETSLVIQPKVDMEKLGKGLKGQIEISLTHPECKKVAMYFDTLAEFKADPRVVYVRNAEPLKPVTKKVWIRSNYNEDVEIESTSSKNDTIKVLAQEKVHSGYQFELEITPPDQEYKRRVFTDVFSVKLKDAQQLQITCYGIYAKKPAETTEKSTSKTDVQSEVGKADDKAQIENIINRLWIAIEANDIEQVTQLGPVGFFANHNFNVTKWIREQAVEKQRMKNEKSHDISKIAQVVIQKDEAVAVTKKDDRAFVYYFVRLPDRWTLYVMDFRYMTASWGPGKIFQNWPRTELHNEAWMEYLKAGELLHKGTDRSEMAKRFSSIGQRYSVTRRGRICSELGRLLAEMAAENRDFIEPENLQSLPADKKINHYIFKLRDVAEQEMFVPGKCRVLFHPATPNSPAVALKEMGKVVIPAMIALLDDRRPTRSVGQQMNNAVILRYCDAALEIIESIAQQKFDRRTHRGAFLSTADNKTREQIVSDVKAWWEQDKQKNDVQVDVEVVGKNTNMETRTLSFGPVVECVVHAMDAEKDAFIDFDTGQYFDTPKNRWLLFDFDVNNFSHRLEWAKKTGADATVKYSENSDLVMLWCYDVASKKVEPDNWQDLRAEQVVEYLSKATHFAENDLQLGHLRLKPPGATRIFKTREGGVGVIQIVELTDNPKGVKIRYKMVQKGPAGKTNVQVEESLGADYPAG